MPGIDNTLSSIEELSQLSVNAIKIFKSGGATLKSIPIILDCFTQIGKLAKDAPESMPELSDLDANEVGQIGAASFTAIKKILEAIAAE